MGLFKTFCALFRSNWDLFGKQDFASVPHISPHISFLAASCPFNQLGVGQKGPGTQLLKVPEVAFDSLRGCPNRALSLLVP